MPPAEQAGGLAHARRYPRRLAAASTTPVVNATMQERSKISLRTRPIVSPRLPSWAPQETVLPHPLQSSAPTIKQLPRVNLAKHRGAAHQHVAAHSTTDSCAVIGMGLRAIEAAGAGPGASVKRASNSADCAAVWHLPVRCAQGAGVQRRGPRTALSSRHLGK
jgi:hypothetical protein